MSMYVHLIDACRGDHTAECSAVYDSLLSTFGGESAADDATPAEIEIYERWQDAMDAATTAGFASWLMGGPEYGYFEVSFGEEGAMA